MEKKTYKCTIRISQSTKDRLERLSEALGLSKSQLFRLGLRILELKLLSPIMPSDAPEPNIKDLEDSKSKKGL